MRRAMWSLVDGHLIHLWQATKFGGAEVGLCRIVSVPAVVLEEREVSADALDEGSETLLVQVHRLDPSAKLGDRLIGR